MRLDRILAFDCGVGKCQSSQTFLKKQVARKPVKMERLKTQIDEIKTRLLSKELSVNTRDL